MHQAFGLLALCALVSFGESAPVNTPGVQQTLPAPPAPLAPPSGSGSDDSGDYRQAFFYPNAEEHTLEVAELAQWVRKTGRVN